MKNLPWDWNQSETAKHFERIIIHMQNQYVQHFPKQCHRKVLLSSFSLNGENLENLNPPMSRRNCYQLFSRETCMTKFTIISHLQSYSFFSSGLVRGCLATTEKALSLLMAYHSRNKQTNKQKRHTRYPVWYVHWYYASSYCFAEILRVNSITNNKSRQECFRLKRESTQCQFITGHKIRHSYDIIQKECIHNNNYKVYCGVLKGYVQLFRERLSDKVHSQSRKVLWVVLSSLFFKEI